MNKIVTQLSALSWGKAFIVGIVLAGLYYVTSFDGGATQATQLTAFKQKLESTKKELRELQEAFQYAENFEREVKTKVDQFNTFVPEFMSSQISTAELMSILSEASSKSGARLMKTEPRPGVEKADFYDTTRIAMTVEGGFSQIVSFLSNLSHVPKLLTFEHIDIVLGDTAGNLEFPKLSFNGVLTAYKYVKPSADSKDAAPKPPTGDPNAKK